MLTSRQCTSATCEANTTMCCLPLSKRVSTSDNSENVVQMFLYTTQATVVYITTSRKNLNFPDIQTRVNKVLSNIVQVVIVIIGVITNIINMIIFSKIGLSDPVTVVLFGLAISDFGYLFLSGISQVIDVLDESVGLRPFEPLKHLAYQVLWWNNMFYDITIFITIFNAIQKCSCVAIPLVFKSIFTRFRSCIIVSFIYTAVFIYYIAIFANPGTDITFDYVRNWTRLANFYHVNNDAVYEVFQKFSRITLPFSSQSVVLLCTIVLIVKLKSAQRTRRNMGAGRHNPGLHDHVGTKNKSSRKELRAIQTVTILSAIFFVCNMPDILITLTEKVYHEFNDTGRYESTYRMCAAIQDIFAVMNSTVNIIVYLKFNSKYRRKFLEVFKAFSRCRLRLK